MNKLFALSLAAATSAVFLAQPVMSEDSTNIVVTPAASHTQFFESVSRDLDRQLNRPSAVDRHVYGDGITIVRFTRSGGKTDDVTIYRASGKRSLDRVAMRAVGRLRSLDNAPAGIGPDQVYQANIIFASDDRTAKKLGEQLAQEEAARLASGPEERTILAFGSAAASPSS